VRPTETGPKADAIETTSQAALPTLAARHHERIASMDQLRAMRVFARIVDSGGFAAAARAMDLAPAVVTRILAELERHLGARLLHRSTRRIALTSIGETYLQRARAILQDIDDANAMAREKQAQPSGPLRVLAPPYFAAHQLVPRLAAFHAGHGDVSVELATAWPLEAPDEAHDVTIIATTAPLEGDFVARRLARAELVPCATPGYLARHGRPCHPSELATHAMLLPEALLTSRGVALRRVVAGTVPTGEAFSVAPARLALETPQPELIHAATMAGLGIGALASYAAHAALADGRLERVLPGWRLDELAIWACVPTRKHMPAGTRAFIDFIVAEFGGRDADPWAQPRPPTLHVVDSGRRVRAAGIETGAALAA
jgi:DNA-binding transcriptional LysR family regulator